MSITEKMRKAFDACTVMAGVEPDFECVYMTKSAALLYLDEIDAENDELRELVRDMWEFGFGCNSGANDAWAWHERTDELEDRMRELGVEVDG